MKFNRHTIYAALTLAIASHSVKADDLLQIYQKALTSDPQVLQAQAQRNSLFSKIDQSRALLLPLISVNIAYSKAWNDPADNTQGLTGSASLNQVLYDHSAWVALTLAEKAAAQADSYYASALQTLITRVTQAYFDVLTAKDNYQFQEAEKRAIERQLEQTKQRFAVGLTAITDVHEAQAQYDLASAAEILAENNLANSYQALSEITGINHESINVLDTERFSTAVPAPASSSAWLTIAENNNIDLLAQRIGKDIAKESISLYKAGHAPSLSLSSTYTKGKEQKTADVAQPDYDNLSAGVTLNVPIFSGFKVSSQVEEAQYLFIQASEQLEQTHRGVIKDVRNNYSNVSASISSIRAYEQSVISSESALKATQAGFEVGTRTIVDVLNRTRDLYNSKRQLSNARYGYITSIMALKKAAGTLSEDDVITINHGLKPSS